MKKLVELCVDGAKVLDLCIHGDELIEQATAAVYNKTVKGVKVGKGTIPSIDHWLYEKIILNHLRSRFPHQLVCKQRRCTLFTARVSLTSELSEHGNSSG